ncbi:MAG TPA: AMP-binding protein [Polyangiaceae bacterium LLY-WYZ-15_(1-7)]|nr:AMP-binding protein [Polyangiaceae bacterium LLY-WYZ-15_(1-7)]HJL07531.1 AMP-binding protein [Polyangiaceae bacterium LLY-WYZ-15_(1-7)]
MTLHVGQLLHQWALRAPERVALVEGDARWTYGDLDAAAQRAAGALAEAGVEPGDRVLLCAANSGRFVATWFGALYAGAAVVPVPILSAPPEIAFRAEHAGAEVAVADGERRGVCARAGLTALAVEELEGPALDLRDEPAGLAMMLYTSGTTGKPKGAAIGHESLFAHTAALVQHTLRFGADEVVLGALPFTHSFGIRMAVLAPFFAGGRVVLPPPGRFDADASLALAAREAVTWLPGVPTMFDAWARTEGAPLRALRWGLSAGAPLADDVRRRAEARLGAEVRQGYGLTEATFTSIDAPPGEPTPGSVGAPVWGIEVRVRDEAGAELPPGEVGEICVRGQNVMRGYLDDPEATAAVMGDGWLRTGDLGRLDARGRLFVVDRLKDLILRGGHNVYPSEVEDAIADHPDVAAVAVVGRDDAHYGEEVVAVLVLEEGAGFDAAAFDAFCRERLSKVKVPREVVRVDALPLGPSRKVLRRTLRDWIAGGRLTPTRLSAAG